MWLLIRPVYHKEAHRSSANNALYQARPSVKCRRNPACLVSMEVVSRRLSQYFDSS